MNCWDSLAVINSKAFVGGRVISSVCQVRQVRTESGENPLFLVAGLAHYRAHSVEWGLAWFILGRTEGTSLVEAPVIAGRPVMRTFLISNHQQRCRLRLQKLRHVASVSLVTDNERHGIGRDFAVIELFDESLHIFVFV